VCVGGGGGARIVATLVCIGICVFTRVTLQHTKQSLHIGKRKINV
jgi:hypothetical protein